MMFVLRKSRLYRPRIDGDARIWQISNREIHAYPQPSQVDLPFIYVVIRALETICNKNIYLPLLYAQHIPILVSSCHPKH